MGAPTDYAKRVKTAMDARAPPATIKTLAEACGISVQAVGQLLNGGSKTFGVEAHAKAARFLGVDPFWLATGTGAESAAEQMPDWPFRFLTRETWEGLDERERGYIESRAVRALERLRPTGAPRQTMADLAVSGNVAELPHKATKKIQNPRYTAANHPMRRASDQRK